MAEVLTQKASLRGTGELVMGRSADSTVNRLIYDLTKIFLQNRSVNHLALPVDGGRGAFICLIYFQDAEMPAYP